MTRASAPDVGDLVWLDFSPQVGREQAGRRPALVLSPASYNIRAGLAVVCPVTNQVKGFLFEVALPPGLPITGVILTDHVKSLDWRERRAEKAGRVPAHILEEVRYRIGSLLGIGPS